MTVNVYSQEYSATFPQTHKSIITFSNGESAEGWVRFYDESKIEVLDQNGESVYLGPSEVRQFEFTVGVLPSTANLSPWSSGVFLHGYTVVFF